MQHTCNACQRGGADFEARIQLGEQEIQRQDVLAEDAVAIDDLARKHGGDSNN